MRPGAEARRDDGRLPGELPVQHRYTPGVAGAVVLEALRDRGVLLASPCASCGITYVPARGFCERCFDELEPSAEVGPGGTLESWALAHIDGDGEPLQEPALAGLVRLDGADTVLLHRLFDHDGAEPEIGMRVEAVLRPEGQRTGSILDLRGFRPAGREE